MMLTIWKHQWVLHCPACDNIEDLEWFDGEDKLGEGKYRCPSCLSIFVPSGKMFKTHVDKYGRAINPHSYKEVESVVAKARREARE
jgi:uncharacterized C2H2 Zn-finger protein